MKRNVLHATVIDTSAAVWALAATFSAYIREKESTVYHCDVMMNFYKNHIELLRDLSLALQDELPSEALSQILIKKSLESQVEFDRLLNQRNMEAGLDPV